jgi:hypothetical protein
MEEQRARALLAGTLALMTSFAESRCPFASARICTNQEPSTDPEDRGAVRH